MRRTENRRWTEEETGFLRRNYRDIGAAQCAEHLKRTRQQVYDKAKALGISIERVFERGPRVRIAPPPDHPAVLKPAEPNPGAVYDSGFIKAPSLARLMGGK